jgi:hypothetical protein
MKEKKMKTDNRKFGKSKKLPWNEEKLLLKKNYWNEKFED